LIALVAGIGGLALCAFAMATSDGAIERALLGEASGRLAWGPALFRALLFGHGLLLAGVSVLFWRTRSTSSTRALARAAPDFWSLAALAALSLAALALRLWRLDSCLWLDEVLTLVDFVRPPLGQVVSSFPSQNQHMLYSVLAHGSVAAFGESAWALRLPSVAFAVGSIWALFFLARRLTDTREALLACTLMAVSYHHVWFSQNARGYMGLLLFSILATWLWLEARTRQTWPWYAAYALSLALGMWIHLTMVFVPLSHALVTAATALSALRHSDARVVLAGTWRLSLAWLVAASISIQLYAVSLPEFLRTGLHEVSLESEWTTALWVVRESLRSLQIGFGAVTLVVAALLVAAVGAFDLARRDAGAVAAMVLPPAVGGALMLALGHNLWPRFFFFAMGFALLIAVHGALTTPRVLLASLGTRPGLASAGTVAGVTAVLVVAAVSLWTLPRAYALPKQDFTGARDYVEGARAASDAVVAVGLAATVYRRYYAPDWLIADSAAELDAILASHARVWLVYTLPVEMRAYRGDIWSIVDEKFDTVRVFPGTLGGGEVNVCLERTHANPMRTGTFRHRAAS
jgi:4-amino-4-deoxy-L-arabinose transferase-like glycosyltransferase